MYWKKYKLKSVLIAIDIIDPQNIDSHIEFEKYNVAHQQRTDTWC